jgi:hypothetical protein
MTGDALTPKEQPPPTTPAKTPQQPYPPQTPSDHIVIDPIWTEPF